MTSGANMSKRRELSDSDRRSFLKGAVLASSAAVTPSVVATAQFAALRADLVVSEPR
jgi:hypothetical protein